MTSRTNFGLNFDHPHPLRHDLFQHLRRVVAIVDALPVGRPLLPCRPPIWRCAQQQLALELLGLFSVQRAMQVVSDFVARDGRPQSLLWQWQRAPSRPHNLARSRGVTLERIAPHRAQMRGGMQHGAMVHVPERVATHAFCSSALRAGLDVPTVGDLPLPPKPVT
eukprot:CAMPEP_0117614088 /NCGR_PEP_ID=MMETSP0784-20121206/83836_1 /TAXON_ID=39447 /ORGANISM="" /LENGTH=164 /DNA_ID=CAMNT_0005417767 /DNA_START=117 /DNA_END=607 /DNA_ORIENTATION=+